MSIESDILAGDAKSKEASTSKEKRQVDSDIPLTLEMKRIIEKSKGQASNEAREALTMKLKNMAAEHNNIVTEAGRIADELLQNSNKEREKAKQVVTE